MEGFNPNAEADNVKAEVIATAAKKFAEYKESQDAINKALEADENLSEDATYQEQVDSQMLLLESLIMTLRSI